MENDYAQRIEEDIRQYKLYKIQVVEAKVRDYKKAFHAIKENATIKFTKNASSNLLIVLFLLVAASTFGLGIVFLFPDQIIRLWEENGKFLSSQDKQYYALIITYLGYVLVSIGILFGFISSLLRKNIKKRNTIYNLSKLIRDVIDTMDDHVKEDKRKYKYFVDSAAEIEYKKRNYARQTQS